MLNTNTEDVLRRTSRTFYIPITLLPSALQRTTASAYLCFRAIDEIEDHPNLDNRVKALLLRRVSSIFQSMDSEQDEEVFISLFGPHEELLPEVTIRIFEWARLAPPNIAPRIWDATSAMADRMANWTDKGWVLCDEYDLDRYTFSVAGSVGLMLCDLWAWFDGTKSNRDAAIGYGRALQAVNIINNREEDMQRGIDFYPYKWKTEDMYRYALKNLNMADKYVSTLPKGPILRACVIPVSLAYATLDTLANGNDKLSRETVNSIVEKKLLSFR
jgi:farnesyl-diphosphate farnesyltransferase